MPSFFNPHEFALLGVILGMPLLGAIINGVFGKRLGKESVSLMALSAVGASFLASVAAFFLLLRAGGEHGGHEGAHGARFVWTAWTWLSSTPSSSLLHPEAIGAVRALDVKVAFSLDQLNGVMALVVTGIGFLIHLYSVGYMAKEPDFHRFFAYLNLFIFSMLVLILGDSLPVLFVGWEGVGLCSYLLIGFWYTESANASAGRKAFITNRIGDFGLLVAMGLLFFHVGSLDWSKIEASRSALLQPVQVWPLLGASVPGLGSLPFGIGEWFNAPRYASVATMVTLALFLGAAGKSAQFPLYVWLPDAMAGPTPVSALIHAATMVTAGVYLFCRMAPVVLLSPSAMFAVALIGMLTALLAATIALVQNDIKKVLAYSTVSQLGFMFMAVGVGAFVAGFFHVVTHAFFKACLFLGAGSVIHAIHARVHDTEASQDMRNMGGMARFMPLTHWTFLASCLAIVGAPLMSGFFSKDMILHGALGASIELPERYAKLYWGWPSWGNAVIFSGAVIAAVMTAFYMTRLYWLTFQGEFAGWKIVKKWKDPHHGHDHDHHEALPAVGTFAEHLEGPRPKESPVTMTAPLVILGALAVVGGLLNVDLPYTALDYKPLETFLDPVFHGAMVLGAHHLVHHGHAWYHEVLPVTFGTLAFVVGVGVALWVYYARRGAPTTQLAARIPGIHRAALGKWYVDEIYRETVIGALEVLADWATWVDRWVVDGIIARASASVVAAVGAVLRYLQTGRVQFYAAVTVVGVVALGWFYVAPHAAVDVVADAESGRYSVQASPGLGYSYRWLVDGKPVEVKAGLVVTSDAAAAPAFGDEAAVKLQLDRNQKRAVTLEVKNAFGWIARETIEVQRPPEDRSDSEVVQRSVLPDGSEQVTLTNGNVQLKRPDGSYELVLKDGSRKVRRPDGTIEEYAKDGSRIDAKTARPPAPAAADSGAPGAASARVPNPAAPSARPARAAEGGAR